MRVSLPTERGWIVSADGGLTLSRTVRGVAESTRWMPAALRSAEARWLAERAEALAGRFAHAGEAEAGCAGGDGRRPGQRRSSGSWRRAGAD